MLSSLKLDMTMSLCSSAFGWQRFGGTYHLYLQDRTFIRKFLPNNIQQTVISILLLTVLTANLKTCVSFPNFKCKFSEIFCQVLCSKDKDCSSQSIAVNLWAIKAWLFGLAHNT